MAMQKGAVLNQQFVDALGLGDRLLTLKKSMLNQPHPTLLEPMFHIYTEEVDEVIYLERQYLYDEQISIKPSYGADEKILMWTYHAIRHRNNDPTSGDPIKVLFASDLFLLGDPREFLRFRTFLKTKRILDAQARDFLAKSHEIFPKLAASPTGMDEILSGLSNITDWPDPENGFKRRAGSEHTLEGVAKDYSAAMISVRESKELLPALLRLQPHQRIDLFRMLSFAEDPEQGARGIMIFLRDIGIATKDKNVIRATSQIASGIDLSRGLDAVRRFFIQAPITK